MITLNALSNNSTAPPLPPLPPLPPNKIVESNRAQKQPYKGKLIVHYKNGSKETYKLASVVRKENNTLWVLFFGRALCLQNVQHFWIDK